MKEEILADIQKEGEDPFKDMEKETPPESPPEIKPEADKPKEGDILPEDQVPFHKHPRWIERENELKILREGAEANAKEIADLKNLQEENAKRFEPSNAKVPEWFKELYGDNEIAWQKYQEHEQAKEQEIETRILARQQEAQSRQTAETAKWNKWVEDEIAKLEATGAKFDRNELIKTMLDYRPTDENNNFDFQKGYKIYEALKPKEDPAHSNARKQLADATLKTSGEPKTKDYMTTPELRKTSWANL